LKNIIPTNTKYIVNNNKKYRLASTNEWYNSVYYYNRNLLSNIHLKDKWSNFIINSYFNSNSQVINKDDIKRKRISLKRIFISKSEIKHNINSVIITLYTFNKQKKLILLKLKRINKMFIKINKYRKYAKKLRKYFKAWIFIIKYSYRGMIPNIIRFNKLNVYSYFYNLNKYYIGLNKNNYMDHNIIKNIIQNEFKYIYLYQYYTTILCILNKIYGKKVYLNIISLKYLFMDASLLVDGVVRKVRDRKKRVLKVIRKIISRSKICTLNSWLRIPNIYKNIPNEVLDLKNNHVIHYENYKFTELEPNKYNIIDYINNKNKMYILTDLKYKFLRGISLKATGRLTKRLTASRSISKIANKGSLQNIYSSSQRISSLMLRNELKCNLQYLNVNSKNRNGSFGIKGWVSSY
jgi:hypothetical protein